MLNAGIVDALGALLVDGNSGFLTRALPVFGMTEFRGGTFFISPRDFVFSKRRGKNLLL
jgi:hypothetical protein